MRAGNYAEAACPRGRHRREHLLPLDRARRARDASGIYREFREAVEQAEAEAEVHAVAILRRAMAEDWRAALAYLERRHPEPLAPPADHRADRPRRRPDPDRAAAGARPDAAHRARSWRRSRS